MIFNLKDFILLVLLLTFVVVLGGCSSSTPIKEPVLENRMSIWIAPEYAPAKIAGYPYIDVPVRSELPPSEQQYAEN